MILPIEERVRCFVHGLRLHLPVEAQCMVLTSHSFLDVVDQARTINELYCKAQRGSDKRATCEGRHNGSVQGVEVRVRTVAVYIRVYTVVRREAGSTCSYVYVYYSSRMGMPSELMAAPLHVLTFVSESLVVDQICSRKLEDEALVELQDRVLAGDTGKTDSQWKRIIQIPEEMLGAGVLEFGEPIHHGTDLIQEAMKRVRVIQNRHWTAQSRHKSYSDTRRRSFRFLVGDRVFLRLSPFKGVMKFARRGKLSPKYIGPFEILQIVGEVAYELALASMFSFIHPVFHVFMLRWYVPNESYALQYDVVELDDRLTFVEESVPVLARDMWCLSSRAIHVVKVSCRHHPIEEATLEINHDIWVHFLGLFELSGDTFVDDMWHVRLRRYVVWPI
ncbi:hypothetical protein MTR67_030814 [Solanum verrucosum]|uniref:Tf2-1-like SH3-like domain-containing protein n=1 Tax=Solanum verrucosum TaxID=315347 RepID=A0AAF0ZGL9_SOLVR|nr:hypothetical protein MTR67_030814 [Solanum verrucosum]